MKYDRNTPALFRVFEQLEESGFFELKKAVFTKKGIEVVIYMPDSDETLSLKFKTALQAAEHFKEFAL